MSVALVNFWNLKRYVDPTISYRLLLSIHDAVLLEVPVGHVERVVTEVIPSCMEKCVEVPGLGLHYKVGDIDVQERWGEKADPQLLLDRGVPRSYCGFKEVKAA